MEFFTVQGLERNSSQVFLLLLHGRTVLDVLIASNHLKILTCSEVFQWCVWSDPHSSATAH